MNSADDPNSKPEPTMKRLYPLLALCLLPGSTDLYSQDTGDEGTNFIRESARFIATDTFGSDGAIEVFATGEGESPVGLSFEEFAGRLEAAFSEGRGGVIDFDNPIYGPAFTDYDRTGVRIFIEAALEEAIEAGTNFDLQPDLQAFYEEKRREAETTGIVDFSTVRPVPNRPDSSFQDPSQRPLSEGIAFARIIALFGLQKERQLVIERGPQYYTEGALATFEAPASEDLASMVNDSHFMSVRFPTYGSPQPISLPFTLNSGMTDLAFDARDNITAVGFTILSAGNFQYWQGLSAEPDRPDNLRVVVEYADGTEEELLSTTRQSSGGWDTFFAIEAPEGTSITRIWVRVVGRNWRTFTFMDDFAFVTEPAPPFVASALAVSGSVGAPLNYRLLTGQSPDALSVDGLPAGLTFEVATGLISGTPTAAGTSEATVSLSNAAGEAEETLTFDISAETGAIPSIVNADSLSTSVTLGRELNPIQVETSLDELVQPGELEYFTLVHRLNNDGSRNLVPLASTGLGMADGRFTGTPLQPGQVGTYEVETFVSNAFGGDSATFELSIFPVVPVPNFDGDVATDIVWSDPVTGTVKVLESGSSYANPLIDIGFPLTDAARDTGKSPETIFFGDLDTNNQADLLMHTRGQGQLDLMYFLEDGETRERAIAELASGWTPVLSGDLKGDGFVSVLWNHAASNRWAVWHLEGDDLAWAGTLFEDDLAREFLLEADFTGNGVRDLLFRHESNLYELVSIDILTGTGRVAFSSEFFSLEDPDWVPRMAADVTGEGIDDLFFRNSRTGQFSIWVMEETAVPEAYRSNGDEAEADEAGTGPGEPVVARTGPPLFKLNSAIGVVTAVDVNEDRRKDLVLLDEEKGNLFLLLMDNARPAASAFLLTSSSETHTVVATGDYNGNKREDLLLHNRDTGDLELMFLGPEGAGTRLRIGNVDPERARFFNPRPLFMDREPAPEVATESLGEQWFELPGLGIFADFFNGWIYHIDHAFLYLEGSPENLWLYDEALGWLWTNTDQYPLMFQARNGFWLRYVEGSRTPRWFYNYIFGFYMTGAEL